MVGSPDAHDRPMIRLEGEPAASECGPTSQAVCPSDGHDHLTGIIATMPESAVERSRSSAARHCRSPSGYRRRRSPAAGWTAWARTTRRLFLAGRHQIGHGGALEREDLRRIRSQPIEGGARRHLLGDRPRNIGAASNPASMPTPCSLQAAAGIDAELQDIVAGCPARPHHRDHWR